MYEIIMISLDIILNIFTDISNDTGNEQIESMTDNLRNSLHTESVMIINNMGNKSSPTKITLKTLSDKVKFW